jgi:beta-glucanase (GH16 family)
MLWCDEFDGPAGSPPDPRRWGCELGAGGWGEDQLQTYTDSTNNARLTGDGALAINARVEPDGLLTSARLVTKGRFGFRFGRVEARVQVPAGSGLWSAVWMLGTDIDTVGWPRCGEIDVMEHVSQHPRSVFGTAHGPGFAGVGGGLGSSHELAHDLADGFHDYRVDWEPDVIRWSVDDVTYHRLARTDVPDGRWVFDHDFFLLVNLAVGGSWPGDAGARASLPATLLVEHVRVHGLGPAPA